jgi:hypothetical protein
MKMIELEERLRQLTTDWCFEKMKAFKAEPFYSERKDIIEVFEERKIFLQDSPNDPIVEDDEVMQFNVSFPEYCWSDWFPTSLSWTGSPDAETLPINAYSVSAWIMTEFLTATEQTHSVGEKFALLQQVRTMLSQTIESMLTEDNTHYNDALLHFQTQSHKMLTVSFGIVEEVHEAISYYLETAGLMLDINQEELGGLLYILNKAGVFLNEGSREVFVEFFRRNVYVTNQKAKMHTRPSDLAGKYREARSTHSQSKSTSQEGQGLRKMLGRLKNAIHAIETSAL